MLKNLHFSHVARLQAAASCNFYIIFILRLKPLDRYSCPRNWVKFDVCVRAGATSIYSSTSLLRDMTHGGHRVAMLPFPRLPSHLQSCLFMFIEVLTFH